MFDGFLDGTRRDVEPNAFVRKSGYLEKVDRKMDGASGDIVQEQTSEKRWYDLYGKRLFFRYYSSLNHIIFTNEICFLLYEILLLVWRQNCGQRKVISRNAHLLIEFACRYMKGGVQLRGEIDLSKARVLSGVDDREFILALGEAHTVLRAASTMERAGWLQALALSVPAESALLFPSPPRNSSLDGTAGGDAGSSAYTMSPPPFALPNGTEPGGAGGTARGPNSAIGLNGLFASPRAGDPPTASALAAADATPRQPPSHGTAGDTPLGWGSALPYAVDIWHHLNDRSRPAGHHSRAPSTDSTVELANGRASLHSSRASHRGPTSGGAGRRPSPTINLHAGKEEIRMAQVRRWRN
jgi:hypothetical protein